MVFGVIVVIRMMCGLDVFIYVNKIKELKIRIY